jgi:hypothetical protein
VRKALMKSPGNNRCSRRHKLNKQHMTVSMMPVWTSAVCATASALYVCTALS